MTQLLEGYSKERVEVITHDGRILIGDLAGYDQPANLILKNCIERVFSKQGVTIKHLGVYIVRGDSVVLVGAVNKIKDDEMDWQCVISEPLPVVEI
ncbi:U6 snRNA-associated Sm-like protein LSm8 [Entamoeba marina]